MSNLPQRLTQPSSIESSMWVDEAIWGHRLHDEQLPWLAFLEFLNIFQFESEQGRAFDEVGGMNTLKYCAAHRLYLRNILFNNPHLTEIRLAVPNDENRWEEWFRRMKAQGIDQADFSYLRRHFQRFDDLCEVVSLARSTGIEVESNKRWTSKFVFPYGKNCLYEDLHQDTGTNDRRFFGRTGEILYLMLSRAQSKGALREALAKRLAANDQTWDSIIRCLQPADEGRMGGERAGAFLPYAGHFCFDELAEDWLAILGLRIPGFDIFPHLVNLAGLHLVRYQLVVSRQLQGMSSQPEIICEAVAPKKTLVRELSCECYQENNRLPAKAVDAFIDEIEFSPEWRQALAGEYPFEPCKKVLLARAMWGEEYQGTSDPHQLMKAFRDASVKRHRRHPANIHRNYGREIGLVSKRGTNKLRYAPTDGLLKTVIFANVGKRAELHQFLAMIHDRYGLVFGDREAEKVIPKDEFDKKAFQANSLRLEQRLGSVGLLHRLSDGCAYVINPYSSEAQ